MKFDRVGGQLVYDVDYNPQWNPNPTTMAGYAAANTIAIDDSDNCYASGYEYGGDARAGVWGICKFNSKGKLVYHASLYDGSAAGYSRGVCSFVFNNKVFHIGELAKTTPMPPDWPNGGYSNVFLVATDTSSVFNPFKKKETFAYYQEFSDVRQISPLSFSKNIIFKQVGNYALIEVKDAYTGSNLWSRKISRNFHVEADKLSVTADNKIYISLIAYPKGIMQFDYISVPVNIEFIKFDSTGNILRDTSYPINNAAYFHSVGLISTADTNTIYEFQGLDVYNYNFHFVASEAFNIERAAAGVTDHQSSLSYAYVPSTANQSILVPLTKDTVATVTSYFPGSPSKVNMLLLTFKNNTGAGYLNPGFSVTNEVMLTHNLAPCDSTSFLILSTIPSGQDEIIRYGSRSRSIIWKKTEAGNFKLDIANSVNNNVYVVGRAGNNLLVRRLDKVTGALIWEKQLAPGPGSYSYIPVDVKYNWQKKYFIVSGYVLDISMNTPRQLAFYTIYDTSGVIIKNFLQAGDFIKQNNLKTIAISPFGQTLIGGALYKLPYGRSGVLLEADTPHIDFRTPTISISSKPADSTCYGDSILLKANISGCLYCQYSWSTIPVTFGDSLFVHNSGNYTFTALQNGVSYSVSKSVVVDPAIPRAGISIKGDTINASGGIKYQWYFNGHIILGVNGQSYIADTPGIYFVKIWQGNCFGPSSDSIHFIISATIDPVLGAKLKISPNPVNGILGILNKDNLKLSIAIYDSYGRLILTRESYDSRINVDLQKIDTGVYFIFIEEERNKKKGTWRILKL